MKKEAIKDIKFEAFKKKILDHLDKLEKEEKSEIRKSIIAAESMQKSGYPVGTIREWKGKKYIKIAPGKWRPKYDGDTRGAKLAVAALKRKFAVCTDSNELMKLVLENRDRFSDENGRPLPFVRELSDYISDLNDKIENTKGYDITKIKTDAPANSVLSSTQTVEGGGKITGNGNGLSSSNISQTGKKSNEESEQEKHDNRSEAMRGNQNAKKDLDDISNVIKNGGRVVYNNPVLDEVIFESGIMGDLTAKNKNGFGIKHLIASRYLKDNMTVDEIAALLLKVKEVVETVKPEDASKVRINLVKDGVWVGLSKQWNGTDETWIITGFPKQESTGKFTKEATDAIQTVIAQNSYALEHSSIREQVGAVIASLSNSIEQSDKKSSGIDAIRDKYTSSKSIDGDEDEINVGKEVINGKWKLVEADAPSASHDESTFHKTKGFPTNEDGSTINDRDYEHDKDAQEAVLDIANDFDGRAVSFDSPVVVSTDGVVISGNNRTMSSKLAAQKGTDKKYIETLKKRAKKFGFTPEQVESFKNPRVVFETDVGGKYSTNQFAKFNESGKKAMNVVEKAVKISKTISTGTISEIADKMGEFETLGDLYKDKKAAEDIFNTFIQNNVIQKTDLSAYYTADGGISESGKEFVETVLIGSVINENNIRQLSTEGGKGIRQKLVRAITPLVENKGMGGYSINRELNEAVAIAIEVKKNPDTFKDVDTYAKQPDMFKKIDPVAVEFAKKLEGTQKQFAEFMLEINGGLRSPANGEYDIFLGGIETKDEVLNRFLHMKKSIYELLQLIA